MGKRHKQGRRSARQEQSQKDKDRMFWNSGKQLADPLAEYRVFISKLRESQDISQDTFIPVPVNLIDLTAHLLTSLITGRDFLSPLYNPVASSKSDIEDKSLSLSDDDKETFFFIKRIIRQPTSDVEPRTDGKVNHGERHNPSISLFLTAVICADKYLYDATYTNQDWVTFCNGHYTLHHINTLERTFLHRQNHNLFFTHTDYLQFLSYLDVMLCLRQMYRWSSLTYTDLLRLSLTVDSKYLNTLNRSLRPYEAVILLLQSLMKTIAQYLAAVAVAAAFVTVAVTQRHVIVQPFLRTIQPAPVVSRIAGVPAFLEAVEGRGARTVVHGKCCERRQEETE
ncbi:hypothetical protein HK097_008574 [Rhizophlyctis rosea]|uniref:Uncharacterized protein n=1 Tax=Rhizophlyctis rosea TaxID=64517 RepID=A0AAD5SL82_9FUNG|nr:hypothetical protein HK097_008574 [Rhizophlyctis rosea]